MRMMYLQQFLTMFGATFSYPLIMESHLSMTGDSVGVSHLISTVIFVSGISTLIQSTFGIRLDTLLCVNMYVGFTYKMCQEYKWSIMNHNRISLLFSLTPLEDGNG